MSCKVCGNRNNCANFHAQEHLQENDRLIGIGLRSWLSGADTGDISCWQKGWERYAEALGAERAKTVFMELGCLARLIQSNSGRKIEFESFDCPDFCRDECLAVAMIAASQHDQCPALESCARALSGKSGMTAIMTGATQLARTLQNADILLGRDLVDLTDALATSTGEIAVS